MHYQTLSVPIRPHQAMVQYSTMYCMLLYQSLVALSDHTRSYQTLYGPTTYYICLGSPTRPYQTLCSYMVPYQGLVEPHTPGRAT